MAFKWVLREGATKIESAIYVLRNFELTGKLAKRYPTILGEPSEYKELIVDAKNQLNTAWREGGASKPHHYFLGNESEIPSSFADAMEGKRTPNLLDRITAGRKGRIAARDNLKRELKADSLGR